MSRAEVYARVTQGILERLEAGVAPWHKPWDPTHGAPRNFVSGRPYNGINALTLGLTGRPPHWLTFQQINRMGRRLRRGSKGVPIIYVKRSKFVQRGDDGEDEEGERFLMRLYYVFNAADVDGLELTTPTPSEVQGVPAAEAMLAAVQPRPVIRSGSQACFSPELDVVLLPPKESFGRIEDYYGTAFHELTHWTGCKSRLNRDTLTAETTFGSPVYSQEELVAEMGAGFLCALAGIENQTIDQSASYLDHWLKVLRADPGMIVRAAAAAQRAVDFLAPERGEASASLGAAAADAEAEAC